MQGTIVLDPVARLSIRLVELSRNPPGRRKAIVRLAALVLALAIGFADRAFDLTPRTEQGHSRLFRWHWPDRPRWMRRTAYIPRQDPEPQARISTRTCAAALLASASRS